MSTRWSRWKQIRVAAELCLLVGTIVYVISPEVRAWIKRPWDQLCCGLRYQLRWGDEYQTRYWVAAELTDKQWNALLTRTRGTKELSRGSDVSESTLGIAADTSVSVSRLLAAVKPGEEEEWWCSYLYGCKYVPLQMLPEPKKRNPCEADIRRLLDEDNTSGVQHTIRRLVKERRLDSTSASAVLALYESGAVSMLMKQRMPAGAEVFVDDLLSATLVARGGQWQTTTTTRRPAWGIDYQALAGRGSDPRRFVELSAYWETHYTRDFGGGMWQDISPVLVRFDRNWNLTGIWYRGCADGIRECSPPEGGGTTMPLARPATRKPAATTESLRL